MKARSTSLLPSTEGLGYSSFCGNFGDCSSSSSHMSSNLSFSRLLAIVLAIFAWLQIFLDDKSLCAFTVLIENILNNKKKNHDSKLDKGGPWSDNVESCS